MIGFILLVYAVFIVWMILGKVKPTNKLSEKMHSVSIVIPYRNEENNVMQLLTLLARQKYASENLELILVNDHSTDKGFTLIDSEIDKLPFKVHHLSLGIEYGKKAAVKVGVETAKNDVIICTDADCAMGENWIFEMQSVFEGEKVQMALGPVMLHSKKPTWFQKLQTFEFASIMAVTRYTADRKRPILSNGANIAFRRELFFASANYEGNEDVASGDDIFLLHAFKRKFGNEGIRFVANEEALVQTEAISDFRSFFKQRIRWAAKSKKYKDYDTIKFGLVISLANVAVLVAFVGFLLQHNSFSFFVGVFCFKWILDLILVQQVPHWLRGNSIVKWSFILSIFYPVYSVGIALLSLFLSPQWKGRKT